MKSRFEKRTYVTTNVVSSGTAYGTTQYSIVPSTAIADWTTVIDDYDEYRIRGIQMNFRDENMGIPQSMALTVNMKDSSNMKYVAWPEPHDDTGEPAPTTATMAIMKDGNVVWNPLVKQRTFWMPYPPTNNLDTDTTVSGKKWKNCQTGGGLEYYLLNIYQDNLPPLATCGSSGTWTEYQRDLNIDTKIYLEFRKSENMTYR